MIAAAVVLGLVVVAVVAYFTGGTEGEQPRGHRPIWQGNGSVESMWWEMWCPRKKKYTFVYWRDATDKCDACDERVTIPGGNHLRELEARKDDHRRIRDHLQELPLKPRESRPVYDRYTGRSRYDP